MGVGPVPGKRGADASEAVSRVELRAPTAAPSAEAGSAGRAGHDDRLETRPRLLAAQDLKLVTQHQDLDLLGLAAPEDEHHEREYAAVAEVSERPESGTEMIGLAHDRTAR